MDLGVLTQEQVAQVVLPDLHGTLRDREHVYFDDLGARARSFELPNDRFKLHRSIDREVVVQLGIQTLTSLNLRVLAVDDDEIVEDIVDRFNNILRSYPKEQAMKEIIANAIDAGANQVKFLLKQQWKKPSGDNLLSDEIASLYDGPSLIIHNDALFTESDFRGIRRLGTGGKRENRGSIGKFGLGFTTLFHFTEV